MAKDLVIKIQAIGAINPNNKSVRWCPQERLREALKHNKRDGHKSQPNIDPRRTHLNYSIGKVMTAREAYDHAIRRLNEAEKARGKKFRKDTVMAVECVFSLPPDFNQGFGQFFEDCHAWVQAHIAGELLSFDVHNDEATPHAHSLTFPLVNGEMKGNAIVGYRREKKLYAQSFHEEVGKKHGMVLKACLTNNQRHSLVVTLLSVFDEDPKAAFEKIKNVVRSDVKQNPQKYLELMKKEPRQTGGKISSSYAMFEASFMH